MEFDIDLSKQTASDDLPDEAEYQMFPAFGDICSANIDDGTSDALGRGDDNVVVFRDLEGIERFTWLGLIQDTDVDSVWHGIVDEFAQDQTVLAFIEELHGVCWDGVTKSYIRIVFNDLCTMSTGKDE